MFETNLRLFIIFQRNLGTSGIVLFVVLAHGFQPSTNVRKISVLDVVGVLDMSQYSVYKFL